MSSRTARLFFLFLLLFASAASSDALDVSDLSAAEAEMEALVADWETQFAEDKKASSELQLALSLQALGIIRRQAGMPEEALISLNRSCDIIQRLAPQSLADPLEAKALVLQDLGHLVEAEKLLRDILARRRETDGRPGLAASLDHLALNLLQQGRYPEVGPLLDEAMTEAEQTDTAFRANLLAHRARLQHTLGSYAKSVETLGEALALDFENPDLRLSIRSQLGLSQLRLGKFQEGYAATLAAAEDAKLLYTARPFLAVPYMNNLGAVALAQGDAETADRVFSEAVGTIQSSLGTDHPSLASPLNNLGVAKQALGDYLSAATYLDRAADLQKIHLPPVHLRVAETQRNLARNALLSGATGSAEAIAEATATGIKLLELLIREGTERERLNFIGRFDLISLPCATGDAGLIANVLIASKARLFDSLLKGGGEERIPEWQDIRASLAEGTVFVDVCRYTTVSEIPESRYGAILISPTGPPQWIPLGSDAELESWLGHFQNRMRWRSATMSGENQPPPALKLRPILRALHRKFWAPVSAAFPAGTTDVAFSPDARFHYIPLAALLDESDIPLCKLLSQITTVTSARDLLNAPSKASLSASPWAVFTVSDYPAATTQNPFHPMLPELQSIHGTKLEAEAIRRIAPAGSEFFHGENATEKAVAALGKAPGVIHMGCHAFFLGAERSLTDLPVDFDDQSDLLSSGGLVLYNGVNREAGDRLYSDTDDLLFPSEIAKLPLRGTRLVTLSSCDSGVGTSVTGEGLLGIRRGFSLAGAREVLVALWAVSDAATPEFMDRFYRLALASDRPAQALWQAQGEFITAAGSTDESFEIAVLQYAPFILSQNASLETGGEIRAPQSGSFRGWLAALLSIPFLCFLLSRIHLRRHSQPT
jgi:CHAT domain-containing protein/tetratricopeptide (TPR) repeat protein